MARALESLEKASSRRWALLIVYFTLVATAAQIALSGSQFAPLMLLSGSPYSDALNPLQLAALAFQPTLAAASVAYVLSTIFCAFVALVIDAAILRAHLFPSVIGALMVLDGAGYLVYGFADVIAEERPRSRSNERASYDHRARHARIAKVLVVDDDRIVAEMFGLAPSRAGHEVLIANDGMAALQAVAASAPDIVFLDVRMPRMDGPEVLRNLAADNTTKEIP